jgi:hypothetical protein
VADDTPVGIGLEAVVLDHDLAFVRDIGGHPGDELQIAHRLLLRDALLI